MLSSIMTTQVRLVRAANNDANSPQHGRQQSWVERPNDGCRVNVTVTQHSGTYDAFK